MLLKCIFFLVNNLQLYKNMIKSKCKVIKVQNKNKACLLMVAMMILNSSFNIPQKSNAHQITKIEKNQIEQVLETPKPEDVVEITLHSPAPTSNVQVDLENIDIKELYNLDSETINQYYELYGYEKAIEYICEHYNITFEQFKVICAIIMAEGNPDVTYQYKESYAVTNVLYNRVHSISFINFVDAFNYYDGHNIFYQAICPNQFEVYQNGNYLNFFGVLSGDSFRGIIDMLISERTMHNYLEFRFANSDILGETFTPRGNIYFHILTETDKYEKDTLQTR